MAMIKYGEGIEQFSGKLGGTIFFRDGCRYHATAYGRFSRSVPTPARMEVRRRFKRACNYWSRKVSQFQPSVESWNTFATSHTIINAKGEVVLMTGWMYFMHIILIWPWHDWWDFILPPYADLPGWAPVWAPEDPRWR